jgi:hypothetical protein
MSPLVREGGQQWACNEKETGEKYVIYCPYNFVPEIYLKRKIAVTNVKELSPMVDIIIQRGDFIGMLGKEMKK